MCCLITVESMLSAVAVSSLMKGLSEYESINRYYLPGVTTGPHIIIWKRKQNSSKLHQGIYPIHERPHPNWYIPRKLVLKKNYFSMDPIHVETILN